MASKGPDIARSAHIIVDMQNDFLHPDGGFAHRARQNPEAKIDMPFLMGTIPQVKRLADAFRKAGRPVVYVAHVLKPDYRIGEQAIRSSMRKEGERNVALFADRN